MSHGLVASVSFVRGEDWTILVHRGSARAAAIAQYTAYGEVLRPTWFCPSVVDDEKPACGRAAREALEAREERKAGLGVEMITFERIRQLEGRCFSVYNDLAWTHGELALAACCYASPVQLFEKVSDEEKEIAFHDPWPWGPEENRRGRHSRIESLARAGALVAAELDRLLKLGGIKV